MCGSRNLARQNRTHNARRFGHRNPRRHLWFLGPLRHNGGSRRQLVVHGIFWQSDWADHDRLHAAYPNRLCICGFTAIRDACCFSLSCALRAQTDGFARFERKNVVLSETSCQTQASPSSRAIGLQIIAIDPRTIGPLALATFSPRPATGRQRRSNVYRCGTLGNFAVTFQRHR